MKEKEKVPILLIYEESNHINVEISKDANHYKLYGFLLSYIKVLEETLINNIEEKKE